MYIVLSFLTCQWSSVFSSHLFFVCFLETLPFFSSCDEGCGAISCSASYNKT